MSASTLQDFGKRINLKVITWCSFIMKTVKPVNMMNIYRWKFLCLMTNSND